MFKPGLCRACTERYPAAVDLTGSAKDTADCPCLLSLANPHTWFGKPTHLVIVNGPQLAVLIYKVVLLVPITVHTYTHVEWSVRVCVSL